MTQTLRPASQSHRHPNRLAGDRTVLLVSLTLAMAVAAPSRRAEAQPPTAPPTAAGSTPAPTANGRPADDRLAAAFEIPDAFREPSADYRSPLIFDDGSPVRSAADWQRRRAEIRETWQRLMGPWPEPVPDPRLEVLDSTRRENFTQHRIRLQWTPQESTLGYLLVPDGPQPMPAAITVYYEPESAIGMGAELRDFALQLTRRGFVTLSLGTTEATEAKTYGLYHPSLEAAKVQPLSMLAYAAGTARRALAARPEVDGDRIGILGHSFGGKWAMFASCLDDGFACAAWSDPGIVFQQDRPSINYWEPWYLGYHPQPWRPRGVITETNPARGLYPKLISAGRDLHELHALMAPRPFLVSGGSEDPVSRWAPLSHTVAVNRLLGFDHRVAMTNRPDHSPNVESNEMIYAFFEHFLGNRSTEAPAPNSR